MEDRKANRNIFFFPRKLHINRLILRHAEMPSTEQLREAMEKVPMPADAKEKPLWEGDEDEMARNCGLR